LQFGIYFHLPYCIKKCPYCDFNSYAFDGDIGSKEKPYLKALLAEVNWYADQLLPSAPLEAQVSSIFFGGGTPSLFSAESISNLIDLVNQRFSLAEDCEVTLEANPGSVFEPLNVQKLKDFRAGGLNRLSLGCQSFSESKLAFLGRVHSVEHTKSAISNFREAGFDNFNLDLIFACKGETLEDWRSDLESALSFDPQHISAYGLTIEPGTEFGRLHQQGKQLNCSDELFAEMYTLCSELLGKSNFNRYEISNYSQPGRECQHNLGYWSRRNYLGFGAGAHSFLDTLATPHTRNDGWGCRWINEVKPERYMEKCNENAHAAQRSETLKKSEALTEYVFTNLRKSTGLNLQQLEKRFGSVDLTEAAQVLKEEGLIVENNCYISLSDRGFLYSDYVFEQFTRTFPIA
jgi:oxygen-independent coproporphyrinogen-3 oxidase